MHPTILRVVFFAASILFNLLISVVSALPERPPNIILINIDDMGYGDLSCYGSEVIDTPHLDRMAQEGRRFTDFMNVSSICTPSRAGLLTGAYPKRIGMEKKVIFPKDTRGLHPNEITMADYLQKLGYQTSCIGKWHLGHEPELLPTRQGFDYYYGIPFSNDMNHVSYQKPKLKQTNKNQLMQWLDQETTLTRWYTPLMENEEVIEMPVDQRTITRRYTDKTIERISKAQKENEPFFIYLAHSMPHVPVYVPEELWEEDFSKAYKIVNEHIDAEVGRILNELKSSGLDQDTIVFFMSDNGPSTRQTGSAKPLRGKKFSNYEGGHRVPFIVWAPGRIPAGSEYHQLVRSIDLLPTFVDLAGGELDASMPIDGTNIVDVLFTGVDSLARDLLYYNTPGQLVGYRYESDKILIGKGKDVSLYDLSNDISESQSIAGENTEKVDSLLKRMHELDEYLSSNSRPAWTKN